MRFVVEWRIIRDRRYGNVVPHAPAHVGFMIGVWRDGNEVREIVQQALLAISKELVQLEDRDRGWIDDERIRIVASMPFRMGSTEIHASHPLPEQLES